jgi:hypothetical protein
MKCVRCGTGLDDRAMVCGQCGAVVGLSYGPPQSRPQAFSTKPMAPHAMAPGTARSSGLVARVGGILKEPRREWPMIAGEGTSALDVYTGYVMPLAALGALAVLLTYVLPGTRFRGDLVDGLASALVAFAFTLLHLYVLSLVVAALLRQFGGQGDNLTALKLTAYSYTPIWLAAIVVLFPALSALWLVGVAWALWIAFVGLPVLARCPPQQAVKVMVLAAVAAFVLFSVIGALVAALTAAVPGLSA